MIGMMVSPIHASRIRAHGIVGFLTWRGLKPNLRAYFFGVGEKERIITSQIGKTVGTV
jgi:hypothetical protein